MKKYLSICILATLSLISYSQVVENVDYNLVGDVIKIYYDINGGNSWDKYEIKVTFINDKGDIIIPRTLSGDFGIVKGGGNKKIEWSVFEDRQGLSGTYKVLIKIVKVLKRKHTILYSVNQPEVSFLGVKYAYMGRRIGGYLNQIHGTDPNGDGSPAWVVGPIIRATNSINPYVGIGHNLFQKKNSLIETGTLITPGNIRLAFDLGLGLYSREEGVYFGSVIIGSEWKKDIYVKLGVGIHF